MKTKSIALVCLLGIGALMLSACTPPPPPTGTMGSKNMTQQESDLIMQDLGIDNKTNQ